MSYTPSMSGTQTPEIRVDEVDDQPLSSLLKSLQNAMAAAHSIDTGPPSITSQLRTCL